MVAAKHDFDDTEHLVQCLHHATTRGEDEDKEVSIHRMSKDHGQQHKRLSFSRERKEIERMEDRGATLEEILDGPGNRLSIQMRNEKRRWAQT